jgi:hypothetical protein
LVSQITTAEQKEIDAYIEKTSKRSERERMADVKTISGSIHRELCRNILLKRTNSSLDW